MITYSYTFKIRSVIALKTRHSWIIIFRHYDHLQLYIQNQIRYRAKNPSLMNHHVCLLIPSDRLKVLPRRQHQHSAPVSLQRACVNPPNLATHCTLRGVNAPNVMIGPEPLNFWISTALDWPRVHVLRLTSPRSEIVHPHTGNLHSVFTHSIIPAIYW